MDLKKIEHCKKLMSQYYNDDLTNRQKNIVRNELFEELMPFLIKWINSILLKNKVFVPQEEIKSLSWDCYCFCLRHHKAGKEIPIPNHFFSYCNFYLKMHVISKESDQYDLKEIDHNKHIMQADTFDTIGDIRAFRGFLEENYVSVFDDALNSMCDNMKDRMRRVKESNLSYYRYCEAKKVFKMVINFLIKR